MRAEAFNIRTASDDSCGGGLGTRLGGATKDSILGGTYNVSAPPPRIASSPSPPPSGGGAWGPNSVHNGLLLHWIPGKRNNKFRTMRNKVTTMLRNSKQVFLNGNVNTTNKKQFWKTMKYMRLDKSTIPTLSLDDNEAISDKDKSTMLNSYFSD